MDIRVGLLCFFGSSSPSPPLFSRLSSLLPKAKNASEHLNGVSFPEVVYRAVVPDSHEAVAKAELAWGEE